jgi:hypothetical protein
VRHSCFASGFREDAEQLACYVTVKTRVYGPDGSLCFQQLWQTNAGCEGSYQTWIDVDGTVIATGFQDYLGSTTLSCPGGESKYCPAGLCSWSDWPARASCSAGTCP